MSTPWSRYGPILEEMYAYIERRQRDRQIEMRAAAAQGTILDKVKQVRLPAPPSRLLSVTAMHNLDALEEIVNRSKTTYKLERRSLRPSGTHFI